MSEIIKFNILRKHYEISAQNIKAVFLFGSVTRGEFDNNSDVDIFILIDDCSEEEYQRYKLDFAKQLDVPIDWISLYRRSTIDNMAKYGSYFLWHIKLEGKELFAKDLYFNDILNNLIRYTRVKNNIMEYKEICKDIEHSINKDNLTLYYELNLISSIIRNISIAILFMKNKYIFGRNLPVQLCLGMFKNKLLFNIDDYNELYKFRLYYSRSGIKVKLKDVDKSYANEWLMNVNRLLDIAEEIIKCGGF